MVLEKEQELIRVEGDVKTQEKKVNKNYEQTTKESFN